MKGILMKNHLIDLTERGLKTQTRRIISPEPIMIEPPEFSFEGQRHMKDAKGKFKMIAKLDYDNNYYKTPRVRYNLGECIYIKENHLRYNHNDNNTSITTHRIDEDEYPIFVKTHHKDIKKTTEIKTEFCDTGLIDYGFKKMSKLLFPSWAARHYIYITKIRLQKLQDISIEDCLAEGIEERDSLWNGFTWEKKVNYRSPHNKDIVYGNPIDAFSALIDSIDGEGTWDSNPLVFAYNYKYSDTILDEYSVLPLLSI